VGVGDDQLGAGQAAGLQRAQERRPERSVLAVADRAAEHLAVAVGGHPGGDDHGLGDDSPVDPGLAVRGVEKDVGVGRLGQRAVAERADFLVEVAQIREISDLEMPVSAPSARTRSSTLRVETPCR
jgi:hypothetical protein